MKSILLGSATAIALPFLLTDKGNGPITPLREKNRGASPAGRWIAFDDLFGAIGWLVSEAVKLITSIFILVDGRFRLTVTSELA